MPGQIEKCSCPRCCMWFAALTCIGAACDSSQVDAGPGVLSNFVMWCLLELGDLGYSSVDGVCVVGLAAVLVVQPFFYAVLAYYCVVLQVFRAGDDVFVCEIPGFD